MNNTNLIQKNNTIIYNRKYIKNKISLKLKNFNILNSTLIVSLTSYPERIKFVYTVLKSLLKQNISKILYHCVLVLAIPEFPNKEYDLPEDLVMLINDSTNIEILWCEKNILSHKKLIPTLKKYPENPILITDDDIIRDEDWISVFLYDHNKYPNLILVGTFSWFYDNNLNIKRFNIYKNKHINFNNIGKCRFLFAKPANGFGGVLYPAHTFTSEEFFNEELMMKLCPTSDESWQYCFNILENKSFQLIYKIYDNSKRIINNTQKASKTLSKFNNYNKISSTLFNYFPEFKNNLYNNHKKIIVSLTSYPDRFKYIPLVIKSILLLSILPNKIVLTLYKDDYLYITDEIAELINNNIIELIIGDIDLKSHLKYFYVMLKYRDYAIITIDDDRIYTNDLIYSLCKGYNEYPNSVISRRIHKISFDTAGHITTYKKWKMEYIPTKFENNLYYFATGVGGILYPPNILDINDNMIVDIKKCITADDIFLKYLELSKNILVRYVLSNFKQDKKVIENIDDSGLQKINVKMNLNDFYIKTFNIGLK